MQLSIETPDIFQVTDTGITHPRDGSPVEFTVIRDAGSFCVRTPSRLNPAVDEDLICGGPARTEERLLVINSSPEDLAEWAAAEVRGYYDQA